MACAAQARRCSLSLGRRRSTRACFARARCRAGCDRFMSRRKVPHRREGSLCWCAAVVRRASCGLQLQASAACLARRRRVGARYLSGGGAVLELSSRARGAAMVVVGPYPAKGRCAGETSLPFGARPLCDVSAAASNFKPAPLVSCGAGVWTLAVSGDEAQHSSLLCACAVPRSFGSVRTLLPRNIVKCRVSAIMFNNFRQPSGQRVPRDAIRHLVAPPLAIYSLLPQVTACLREGGSLRHHTDGIDTTGRFR